MSAIRQCARNVAHRGSAHFAPENTRVAFERAVAEDGADGIELDVQLGGDGNVYVLHDTTVDRTTNGQGRLRDLDQTSIAELDAGYRYVDPHGEHSFRGLGVEIPRLREILVAFPETWFSIDLKEGGHEVELRVTQILRELDCAPRCVVGAENPAAAGRLRRLLPPPFRHFLDRGSVREFYLRHRLGVWAGYRPPGESLQIPVRAGRWALDRPQLIRDAHRRGIDVLFWTIDEVHELQRLLEMGADGIITNRPDRLRELLSPPAAP